MFTRELAIIALLLIPTFADAQRRTRGERRANFDQIESNFQSAPRITKSDLESFSAIKLIVDKRKDLKLSDDQLKQFKDLHQKEAGTNEGLYKQVDSLRMAMRKRAGADEDQERARTTLARQELLSVIRQIRANYDSTFQAGMPLLDETQKQTATQLVEKEHEEAEEDLRSKLSGGGARQSGSQTRRRP